MKNVNFQTAVFKAERERIGTIAVIGWAFSHVRASFRVFLDRSRYNVVVN